MARPETSNSHLDRGRWTPQTQMLRCLEAFLSQCPMEPRTALSIDLNESIDRMVMDRWPSLVIQRAVYPEVDCQALPMAEGAFDFTYSHQVLEHVPKPWRAAEEILRVTKRGGLGLHTTCAFNPRHGPPAFEDYYRFLPAGVKELFPGVEVMELGEWGNREAIRHNASVDDGYGPLGGRRFGERVGSVSDGLYPWLVWILFRKL